MNTPSNGISRQISEEIERYLLHFEQTWGQHDAPSIEQLLKEVSESERANLLRELLFIEFEFIQRKATEPLTEHYLTRFPEYTEIIHEVSRAIGQYAVFKRRNVAGYTLLDELGRGGMGTVYKAKSDLLNNVVAFKMVSQRMVDNPELLKRFIRELEMIGRLKHPNIVEAKHAGVTDDGTPYLVMEYVEGITLAEWGRHNPPSGTILIQEPESSLPFPLPSKFSSADTSELKTPQIKGRSDATRIAKICDIICAAALGLQAIHEAGLVHRDIKPGNIMVLPDGQVKILDLGLAKLREHIAEHPSEYSELTRYAQTQQGQFLGTPGYVAPEQMHSATDVDIRADIYSLGCTFFYLLYGRTPSERQLDEMPVPVPKKVRAILDKMLAADPASRFQEPREVADALDSFLGRKKNVQRGQVHWGKILAAALSFAVVFGIAVGLLFKSPNPVPASEPGMTMRDVEEAIGFRYQGNPDEAERRLRTLEIDLRENPFEGSDHILAEVLSALGDCYFFEGFASDLFTDKTEKKVRLMTDWYDKALELAENSPDDFHMKLISKRAVVNNAFDMLAKEENPSIYHHFAEAVTMDNKQSLRDFVRKRFELGENLTSREALDLRLFVCEKVISWTMVHDLENLPEDVKALNNIIPLDLDPNSKEFFTAYMNRLVVLALNRNRDVLPVLFDNLPDWQKQEETQGTMQ